MILQALVDFTKHRESCTLAPLKINEISVDFNTGKTCWLIIDEIVGSTLEKPCSANNEQKSMILPLIFHDFPMFFRCFFSLIQPGSFEPKQPPRRTVGSLLQVDRLHGLPQKLLPVLVTEISCSLRLKIKAQQKLQRPKCPSET